MRYQQKLTVDFEFNVVFSREIFAIGNNTILDIMPKSLSQVLFFIDEGLAAKQPELSNKITQWCEYNRKRVNLVVPPYLVTGGEKIKNSLEIIDKVGYQVQKSGMCRQSYIFAVGGGAVLDAVGLAASVIHRGMRHIRIPTTVLSQNDSGVGVKNGINRFGSKNYYGCFNPPNGVIADFSFLRTLDDRQWKSGVAEAFKVAIIKDQRFLDYLLTHAEKVKNRDEEVMEQIIRKCAWLHLDHIQSCGDPFERGSDRPLDFGHWVSHWLETVTDYRLNHGEAVAVGLAVDLQIASKLGFINTEEVTKIMSALETIGLSLWDEKLEMRNSDGGLTVMRGLEQFREHLGGSLRIAMPDGPGKKQDLLELKEEVAAAAIKELKLWVLNSK